MTTSVQRDQGGPTCGKVTQCGRLHPEGGERKGQTTDEQGRHCLTAIVTKMIMMNVEIMDWHVFGLCSEQ